MERELSGQQGTIIDTHALERIITVVGQDYVITDPAELEVGARDLIPHPIIPPAFVYPGSVAEIQSIVSIANQHRISLWPCSKGKNWGYGGATATSPHTIILVLERLNRILEVNSELGFAVVEPGVTYRQLHQHLRGNRYKLWLDATDGPADGSVMGNALERGIGETPYGDHFGNICGMEVILPTGELVRTGGGPMEDYRSWNTYKWGVGPYLEGLFSQSNFGIVTKVGIWLMREPEDFSSVLFELSDEKRFPEAINAMRELALNGALASKIHMINDVVGFSIIAKHPRELLDGSAIFSDQQRAVLRKRFNVAPWTFAGGIYGSSAQVRASRRLIKDVLGKFGRLQFLRAPAVHLLERMLSRLRAWPEKSLRHRLLEGALTSIAGKPLAMLELLPHMFAIERGEPSDYFVKHAYFKARCPKPDDNDIDPARDQCGLIWLGPMVPMVGPELQAMLHSCAEIYKAHAFDFTVALMLGNPRTMIALLSIFYDKGDHDETERAQALYFALGQATQAMGYQQYRTSTAFMSKILDPAPEYKELAARLKQALDPRNVLAPGKYGIMDTERHH